MPRIEPFERFPLRYDNWFNSYKYVYQSELLAIKKFIPKNKFGVEIGIGTGRFASPLGIDLGIEPSAKMRMICLRKNIEVIDSIAEKLPFRSLVFDYALMVTTICFVDYLELAFSEIFDLLKPKGVIIIGFIDRDSPIGRLYEQNKQTSVFYKYADFYSVKDVLNLLSKVYFNNFKFYQTLFHPLSDINEIETVKKGYGEGSFVVIKASKYN